MGGVEKALKIVFGLLLVIGGGYWYYLRYLPELLVVLKGVIGLAIIVIGLIIIALGATD